MDAVLILAQSLTETGEQARAAVESANFIVAALVAFAAGLVSFASPCVVPLVPGYLAYMTGLSGAELRGDGNATATATARLRILAGGSLFVLGFAVPFTALGLVGAALSAPLSSRPWQIALGLMVVFLGVAFTGLLPFDFLKREARITDSAIDNGVLGAFPLGFVFGVGWTPCIGPALGAILTLAANTEGSSIRGGGLAFVYALGLGLPFILFGLLFNRLTRVLNFLRSNSQRLQIAGGALLSLVGLAIATGLWEQFILRLQPLLGGFEAPI